MPPAIARLRPGEQNDVDQFSAPQDVEPRVFDSLLWNLTRILPTNGRVLKHRLLRDHRAFLGAQVGFQIKVRVSAFLNCLFLMQFRQFARYVISSVVVRLMECVANKIFNAHSNTSQLSIWRTQKF
jgi:hypothetical protein